MNHSSPTLAPLLNGKKKSMINTYKSKEKHSKVTKDELDEMFDDCEADDSGENSSVEGIYIFKYY